ncbi:hypothetical protein BC936DRAFT_143603 [Jimgerdemannia flammicorona]|uniref:Uncharacterized protein n=1 Tax=Jimgerdemannia flammicorona TaxID=994334 RepID=A0A433DDL5_9FUNG|nr:hypothetical protein BC936DRAFT_143603 [Jimgerdemannia flammicorona]
MPSASTVDAFDCTGYDDDVHPQKRPKMKRRLWIPCQRPADVTVHSTLQPSVAEHDREGSGQGHRNVLAHLRCHQPRHVAELEVPQRRPASTKLSSNSGNSRMRLGGGALASGMHWTRTRMVRGFWEGGWGSALRTGPNQASDPPHNHATIIAIIVLSATTRPTPIPPGCNSHPPPSITCPAPEPTPCARPSTDI